MRVLGIDPGSTHSAYALLDSETCRPLSVGKVDNHQLRRMLREWAAEDGIDRLAVEMIESYGMAVGREVFHTCVWVGRYCEIYAHGDEEAALLIGRPTVKLHHCGQRKAKDANIVQALIDRFAPDKPNRGKGTKAAPGWFHGFAADVWQAYALAVVLADQIEGREGVA